MPRRATDPPLTIGAVLTHLAGEFPDITISKIRFLESEGLIEPARSSSGYRQFRAADVARLEYILRAQREHFWPLRVIKESLEALDRGLTLVTNDAVRLQVPTPAPDPDLPDLGLAASELRLTAAEVAEAVGAQPALIDELCGHGLIAPDPDGHFDEDALRIVTAVHALAAYGIEARHLRPFRTTADREVGLVEQAIKGRSSASAAQERAEVARWCVQLHAALLKSGLRR
ncbi:MAG TPA: MerR family transcriptional regulator [Phycicoccus sp.]|nr:MerR family transcriptional regulator [Phycicoccus sp.]